MTRGRRSSWPILPPTKHTRPLLYRYPTVSAVALGVHAGATFFHVQNLAFARATGGTKLQVEIPDGDFTVNSLKSRLCELTGVPPESQKVIFKGKTTSP